MVSGCNATALFGDVIPDIIEIGCACGDTRCGISGTKTAQRRDELGRAVSLPQQDRAWIPVWCWVLPCGQAKLWHHRGLPRIPLFALALFPQQQCFLSIILGTVKRPDSMAWRTNACWSGVKRTSMPPS